LSLKDLSLLDEVTAAPLCNVAALKIEGRQKRPEYVAAAVSAFRAALDGVASPVSQDELRRTFSRSGFTRGYYDGTRGAELFGIRTKDDMADPQLLGRMRKLYDKPVQRVPLNMQFFGEIGQAVQLTACALGKTVTVTGGVSQPATACPLPTESVRRQLQKLGDTPYKIQDMEIRWPKQAFLPLGELNALRRKAIAALQDALCNQAPLPTKNLYNTTKNIQRNEAKPAMVLRFSSHLQVPAQPPPGAKIFLPCETAPHFLRKWEAQVTIPTGIFGTAPQVLQQLRAAKAAGVREAMAQTLDGVALALEAGLAPVAGEGMNLCNSESFAAIKGLGAVAAICSVELDAWKIKELASPISLGALVYGRLRLMLCRACPVKAQQSCGQACALTDRRGMRFPIRCRNGCVGVYNSRPLWLADVHSRLPEMDFYLFSFTVESAEECAKTLQAWQTGAPAPEDFTRGWFGLAGRRETNFQIL
jgi:putative protease